MPADPRELSVFDPVEACREIGKRYRQYLRTSFYFGDPVLRHSFEKALEEADLVRGPFLEATPVYRRGKTSRELIAEILGRDPDPGFANALVPDRSLYFHQEAAILRLAADRNVVVSTGTGSGKTEAYVIPILLNLYKERLEGKGSPGVRALIIYPMNALANDQRRRLGECCRMLTEGGSGFSFTFGRYTGETPEDERDRYRHARAQIDGRLKGELVLRREMREAPPDILLTNYSMLEYLLLRPKDSRLFDGGRGATWRFLVLDEAHQYRGAKGIETAMLIRRLKQRLHEGGQRGSLQCIATSASLGGGNQDREDLADFARNLFGEPFDADDIILEKTAPLEVGEEASPLSASTYQDLSSAFRRGNHEKVSGMLRAIALDRRLPPPDGMIARETLYCILVKDARARELRRLLSDPCDVDSLGGQLFPELPAVKRPTAISALVDLLMQAKDASSGAPLLSARYHLFVRGLEGAFVRYQPQKEVSLSRGVFATGDAGGSAAWFEVALCRECGQHYLVGRRENNRLVEAVRDPGQEDYQVTFFRPVEGNWLGETNERRSRLCLRCGALSARTRRAPSEPDCDHGDSVLVVEEETRTHHEDQVRTCGTCGYRGRDPVREIIHGTDGPNAVIATALHRLLPTERRKVLAFADGRQDAAFFAWYVEQTYGTVRDRGLVLESLRGLAKAGHREVDLRTLAQELNHLRRCRGVAGTADSDSDTLREAWLIVLRELLSDQPRISLEGVGLVRWFPTIPGDLQIPTSLRQPPWSFDEDEARTLALFLLDTLRTDFAMELPSEAGLRIEWEQLGLKAYQARMEIAGQRSIKAWAGPRTRRAMFLSRVLEKRLNGVIAEAERIQRSQELLRELWKEFLRAGGEERLVLRAGNGKRANPKWWRAQLLSDNAVLYRCDVCGRHQNVSIEQVCARFGCPGSLAEVTHLPDELKLNHYRILYHESLPPRLRAEEHTAQIERGKAREFQEDFNAGLIHLLSCSTTFELGVDLGDLDTIFLRNVPPEPFNYAQRVGRAGRRAGRPGFALTYCRRRPHDLIHFAEPEKLLSGKARPPSLTIQNEKIALRHVAAVVLSQFFRENPDRFAKVHDFFVDLQNPRAVNDLCSYLTDHSQELRRRLESILPERLQHQLGLTEGTWITGLAGPDTPLEKAEREVSEDYRTVRRLEEDFAKERSYRKARWASDRAKTIEEEDVISFLSRKAVIPKYGFPVDVVELDLQRARRGARQESSDVALQRDLAIAVAEFAPGTKVIANKKLWTSHGLKRVAGREWPRWRYRRCNTHGTFEMWPQGDQEPGPPCCSATRPGSCIDPIFGFIVQHGGPEEPTARPERLFTTRPYFSGRPSADPGTIRMGDVALVTKASPGNLVVLCEGKRGEGFYICRECGAGFTGRPRSTDHETPFGTPCRGSCEGAALGHEFLTDVLLVQFLLPPGLSGDVDRLWFYYSLAYALLQGAAGILEVPLRDLNVTVKQQTHGSAEAPRIVLYDNVPGGAGLVARLEQPEVFRGCLEAAHVRIAGSCGCAPDSSCYGCLRHYANQFAHPYLRRGPVYNYLNSVLQSWV